MSVAISQADSWLIIRTFFFKRRWINAIFIFFLVLTLWLLAVNVWEMTVLYTFGPGFAFALVLLIFSIGRGVYVVRTVKTLPVGTTDRRAGIGSTAVLASVFVLLVAFTVLSSIQFFKFYSSSVADDLQTYHLGGLTATSVNVWVRTTATSSVTVKYRPSNTLPWQSSAVPVTSNEDYTGLVNLNTLTSQTTYEYTVAFGSSAAGKVESFRTLPTANTGAKFSFVSTSCSAKQEKLDHEMEGFRRISNQNPDFVFHVGDLIYADIPASASGLRADKGSYESMYRFTYTDQHLQNLYRRSPVYSMLDDHEFFNDYKKGFAPNDRLEGFQVATSMWETYSGRANTGRIGRPYYYNFTVGKTAFFVFDTLTELTPPPTDGATSEAAKQAKAAGTTGQNGGSLLGEEQMKLFQQWAVDANSTAIFKILVTPNPFSRNWGIKNPHNVDWWTWPDYVEVQQAITDLRMTGVLFISGDAHVMGAWEVGPGLLEVSASPIATLLAPTDSIKIKGPDKNVYFQNSFDNNRRHFAKYEVDTLSDQPSLLISLHNSLSDKPEAQLKMTPNTAAVGSSWEFYPDPNNPPKSGDGTNSDMIVTLYKGIIPALGVLLVVLVLWSTRCEQCCYKYVTKKKTNQV